MRRIIIVLAFLWFGFGCVAQIGTSFLTHYAPSDERIDFRCVGMVQDQRGLIYFTNKRGVLEFDGKNWQLIATPGAVYTLVMLNNELFAGGAFGFGKIAKRTTAPVFQSIVATTHIFSGVEANGKLYACNEASLFIISADQTEKEIKASPGDSFLGLLEIQQQVFVKSQQQPLRQLANDTLGEIRSPLPVESEIIFTASNDQKNQVLIGTEHGKMLIIDEKLAPAELKLADAAYVHQNKLVSAVWVNDRMIAVGTLLGGALLVDHTTGATVDLIDYSHGLPDNEVFCLLTDQHDGVWVAHQYGFSRIAPSVPFRSFNRYDGIEGNLLCAKSINNTVYVGTSLGLYKLSKDESIGHSNVVAQTLEKNAEENSRRGLFGFLRKRSKPVTSTNGHQKKDAPSPQQKPATYSYKRVQGISGKVTQLIDINGKLVAAGLNGVFEIDQERARQVVTESAHHVFFSPSLQQLLVSTFNEQTKSYLPSAGWKEMHALDTLNDYVSYAFEDNLQNIWLCARSSVYKVETLDGVISAIETIPMENPSLDEMVGVAYGREVYVASSGEFKRFNGTTFVRYDSLPGPHRYFASAGYFWFNDGSQWRTPDQRLQSLKLQWLGLFPNLRYLSPDENAENLWVITAANELYKFSGKSELTESERYPLLLRGVTGREINLVANKKVILNQPENVLAFEFVQPDYVGRYAMQYRYQVAGLTNGWSAWSSENYLASFPFLPPGNYKLSMQARDLLGNESKIEVVNFEVLPPYWKRWWFYALEFLFFTVLMFLSVRLSNSNKKYRYVSEILSLLTVIIFIQFISTGINSFLSVKSSPVIQFFIQVLVALLVFPLENYFRRFMQAAMSGRYQLKFKPKQN